MKSFIQNSQSLGQDWNTESPEYEGVLLISLQHQVFCIHCVSYDNMSTLQYETLGAGPPH
jgi:hypothetical protein